MSGFESSYKKSRHAVVRTTFCLQNPKATLKQVTDILASANGIPPQDKLTPQVCYILAYAHLHKPKGDANVAIMYFDAGLKAEEGISPLWLPYDSEIKRVLAKEMNIELPPWDPADSWALTVTPPFE